MSLFDKDIVESELGFDPDTRKNIEVQIERHMRGLVSYFNHKLATVHMDMMGWLQYMLDSYMSSLLEEDPPADWRGPYKKIRGYDIRQLKPDGFCGLNGFEILYGMSGELDYLSTKLAIYEEEELNILKHAKNQKSK